MGVPWFIWCSIAAVTSAMIGVHWDISWHRSIGRDSFWTPAHMAIYLCGVLAGLSCGYLILATTFTRNAALRDAYGRTPFGQGCLLARRLVERGVPFVEVSLNSAGDNPGIGWDTHQDNFNSVRQLCEVLDPAWATLLDDLSQRGLLESTLVLWMGEFGRTPQIAAERMGRDHYPAAWSTVLCGGGIRGGQVIGKTSADGMQVEERKVDTSDLLATVCHALGIDPLAQNISNVGRPIRIVDPEAMPIDELLAS